MLTILYDLSYFILITTLWDTQYLLPSCMWRNLPECTLNVSVNIYKARESKKYISHKHLFSESYWGMCSTKPRKKAWDPGSRKKENTQGGDEESPRIRPFHKYVVSVPTTPSTVSVHCWDNKNLCPCGTLIPLACGWGWGWRQQT